MPYVANLNVVTGGNVSLAVGYNSSTLNISDGNVNLAVGFDTSTLNISGGSVNDTRGFNTSTLNISGGSVTSATGSNTSTTNISGGTLPNGFLLSDTTATVNFIGTGLSFAYQSYNNNNSYNEYADFFQVSGIIGGVTKSYDLYIRNDNGHGGPATPNSAARDFTFNGGMPVMVPEGGTFALILPAFALLGAVVRRKK